MWPGQGLPTLPWGGAKASPAGHEPQFTHTEPLMCQLQGWSGRRGDEKGPVTDPEAWPSLWGAAAPEPGDPGLSVPSHIWAAGKGS